MNPELAKALAELATKLGTSIEYLWPKMVLHAKASAITGVCFGSLFFAVCITVSILSYYHGCKCKAMSKTYFSRSFDEDFQVFIIRLLRYVPIAFALFAYFWVAYKIPDLVVPETAAIRSLINQR
jgi:hypothetical protein